MICVMVLQSIFSDLVEKLVLSTDLGEFYWVTFKSLKMGDKSQKLKGNDNCESDLVKKAYFQVFMKTLDGKSTIIRVFVGDLVQDLKHKVLEKLGIPTKLQSLIFAGKSRQDVIQLQEYGMEQDSSIIINLRLCGECPRSNNTKGPVLFKDVVNRKAKAKNKSSQIPNISRPYIEKMN